MTLLVKYRYMLFGDSFCRVVWGVSLSWICQTFFFFFFLVANFSIWSPLMKISYLRTAECFLEIVFVGLSEVLFVFNLLVFFFSLSLSLLAAKLIGSFPGCEFFKNADFFGTHLLNENFLQSLETVFVGLCEMFVYLEFEYFFLGRETHRSASRVWIL